MEKAIVKPADGKLGVLCVGLGAVATTFITGVLIHAPDFALQQLMML